MAFVKFSEFMDMIDREVKQKRQDNVTTVRDSARLAKQVEVAHWVNQTLGFFSSLNDRFWRHNQTYTPDISTNKLTLPFYWKRLDTIVIGTQPYKVGLLTDLRHGMYCDQGNIIVRRNGNFEAGTEITFCGTFRPNKLPTNGTADDLEAFIDLDPDWINLLKLAVLVKYGGKQETANPLWYGQYQEELKEFKQSGPTVQVTYTWRNKILWGEHF